MAVIKKKTKALQIIFSEYALIKFRLKIEIEWLLFLRKKEIFSANWQEKHIEWLKAIETNFSLEDAKAIKNIEQSTNHDVKAVEYFLKEKLLGKKAFAPFCNWIHFACTSEDINNLSHALMMQKYAQIHKEHFGAVINKIKSIALENADIPMLSLTHGQSATPTTLGKEMAVFHQRLKANLQSSQAVSICAKFNGAVGNYNAHKASFAKINWQEMNKEFVESFGLTFNPYTTQIEPHDYLAEIFDSYKRGNVILLDFARDIWGYISRGYFGQKLIDNEIGSSTMPHKVNPIDFENAEGNLQLANALLQFFAEKLPISRYQRDLTDSTVLRNIGVALAHQIIAYSSLIKGINKLNANLAIIKFDIENAWEVLAEPIQTLMRIYGYDNPYEQLKELSRGKKIDKETLQTFISKLDKLPEKVKKGLLNLTPETYIGFAKELTLAIEEKTE